jgi:thioredoxin 1
MMNKYAISFLLGSSIVLAGCQGRETPVADTTTVSTGTVAHASSSVDQLTSDTFDQYISNGKVIVDFGAPWCGWCVKFDPIFEETAAKYKGQVKFGHVDTDENRGLGMKYASQGIPQITLFENGKIVAEQPGYAPLEEFDKLVRDTYGMK